MSVGARNGSRLLREKLNIIPYIYRTNKKERALQAFCVEAFANRWMGTLRTTCNGLTARE